MEPQPTNPVSGEASPGSERIPPPDTCPGGLRTVVAPSENVPPSPGGKSWPTIPGYEILSELGRGSMGVVYKARQLNLHRLVALKMIHAGGVDDETQRRFVEEARVVASLQHPNIVQIYEINLRQESPYFSMEMVEGGTLADRLGGRPQPFRQAAQLVQTLARAIHVAHQGGIVHRDLKPANILVATLENRGSKIENRGSKDDLLFSILNSPSSILHPRSLVLVGRSQTDRFEG